MVRKLKSFCSPRAMVFGPSVWHQQKCGWCYFFDYGPYGKNPIGCGRRVWCEVDAYLEIQNKIYPDLPYHWCPGDS